MVDVQLDGETVIFNIRGFHKLLSFKSKIVIARKNIISVSHVPDAGSFYKGIRAPGTHIPGLIAAGTFHHEGKKVFWDVFRSKNCVIVDLNGEKYDRLLIEVQDPPAVVDMLTW